MENVKLLPRWDEIAAAAKTLGATDWAIRKWGQRRSIPGEWRVKIFRITAGRIPLDAMEFDAPLAPTRSVTPATMQAARHEEAMTSAAPEALP